MAAEAAARASHADVKFAEICAAGIPCSGETSWLAEAQISAGVVLFDSILFAGTWGYAAADVDAQMGPYISTATHDVTCPAPIPVETKPVCKEPPAPKAEATHGKSVVGEKERILLDPPGKLFVARMDTGATSSSLHAQNIVQFERDGANWVRFELQAEEGIEKVEAPIVRYARVVQQADPQGSRRPVVSLRIQLGEIDESVEFTLADRSHLETEVLLGRGFLTDLAIVDVSRKFIQPLPKK